MSGDHVRAERADEQRRRDEQTRFHQYRDAHRHAELQQCVNGFRTRQVGARERRVRFVMATQCDVRREREELQPQHQRGRHARPFRATTGDTECAVHEEIADRPEHEQTEKSEVHGRPRARHAFRQSAQREIAGERGCAPGNRAQEFLGVADQRVVDADRMQQRRGVAHADQKNDAQEHRQPQRLPEQRTDALVLPRAGELRNRRRQRKHHADRGHDDQRPHTGADRDGRQRGRTEMTGEHRVDHIHADRRQLPEHQRCGEHERFAHFAAQPFAWRCELILHRRRDPDLAAQCSGKHDFRA